MEKFANFVLLLSGAIATINQVKIAEINTDKH